VYLLKNAKHLLIPLFNVEISRLIAFWNGENIGFLLRKVKFSGTYQTGYEHWLKRYCFGYPGHIWRIQIQTLWIWIQTPYQRSKNRFKISWPKFVKTVSFDAVIQKLKVCQMLIKKIYISVWRKKCFLSEYEISSNSFFVVKISRFIPFWIAMDTGFIFLK